MQACRRWIWCLTLTPLLLSPFVAASDAPVPTGFSLSFRAVGTPEFLGPPKITEPDFVPPIAERVQFPTGASCLSGGQAGLFEAFVDAQGKVVSVHSYYEPIAGTPCQKAYLFPALLKWEFHPATFQGKPTAVYLRIWLNE